MKRKFWTKEEIDYLTENYADKKNEDLSLILDRTKSSIAGKSGPLGLKKSKAFWKKVGGIYAAQCKHTQFKKGNISFNKGKKQVDYMSKEKIEKVKKTQFKKGNRPHNAKGPDYESIIKQSKEYCYRLKKDANGVLVYHHRLLWEEHNGKIPKDMIIIFKNKDTLDCRIENLMAITRSEHLERNYLQYPNEIKRGIKLKNKLEKQLKN
jgi:hypothetical protein